MLKLFGWPADLLTDHFAIVKPSNPSIDEFYAVKKCRSMLLRIKNGKCSVGLPVVWKSLSKISVLFLLP